jgi:hypothetical protein
MQIADTVKIEYCWFDAPPPHPQTPQKRPDDSSCAVAAVAMQPRRRQQRLRRRRISPAAQLRTATRRSAGHSRATGTTRPNLAIQSDRLGGPGLVGPGRPRGCRIEPRRGAGSPSALPAPKGSGPGGEQPAHSRPGPRPPEDQRARYTRGVGRHRRPGCAPRLFWGLRPRATWPAGDAARRRPRKPPLPPPGPGAAGRRRRRRHGPDNPGPGRP